MPAELPAVDFDAGFASVDAGIVLLQSGTSLFAAVFGFGDAIIAMPMLAIVFHQPPTAAAPLVTLVGTLLICLNLLVDIKDGQMQECG